MLLAVNVNNTHTLLGIYDGDRLAVHWRLRTDPARTVDEYVVLLVGIDSGGGLKVAERVRRAIEDHRFLSREGARVRITASIGLASYPEHAEDKAQILDFADRAMYRGKRSTRNVVYMASKDLPPVPAGERE